VGEAWLRYEFLRIPGEWQSQYRCWADERKYRGGGRLMIAKWNDVPFGFVVWGPGGLWMGSGESPAMFA
jgi:hypothetical protein